MEEEINLATFQFDTAKLETSLNNLQDRMFALKKENQEYTEQMKSVQKATQALTNEQLKLIASGQELSDEYKENEKLLKDLNESEKQLYKNQQNVAISQGRVRQEIFATTTQLKAYTNAQAQQVTLSQQANDILLNQVTNINEARASNTELLRVRNQLNPSIEEEANLLQLLNERLNQNNAFIRENVSEYEQQKINIGNYSESIKTAFSDLNLFNGGLTGFISRSQEAGGASNLLRNSLTSAATGFMGLVKSSLAFLATPIGAVIALIAGAFLLIKNAMDKNIESADKVTSVFKAIGSIFNTLLKILEPIGTFIIDVLVSGFELLGNAAESALNIVSAGLDLLGFEDAAQGVRDFTNETKESTKQAYELAKAERELEQAQQRARLTQLEYQKDAEKLRQVRDDESKSLNERINANRELGLLLDEQAKKELEIAQQALKVSEMRASANKLNKEIQSDYVDALTEIADIEERITGQRSEQLANENSLRKEYADAEKKRQDEAIAKAKERSEAAIKAMQTELDFYIESQGERKKSMEDQLAIDKEIMKQSLAVNKAEFDAKKITRREYELANLEVTNEFAAKQVEATIENANIEFELFKLNNQRKIDENQFFSDELYNQELDRINKIAEAEAAQQTLAFSKGLINAQEYGLAIAHIDENQRLANEEARKTREQAEKEQQAANLSLQDELNSERFEYDLALQTERNDRERAQAIEDAKKTGADVDLINQVYDQRQKERERAVLDNKLAMYSDTLSGVIGILGKESAAGKALAIAQATVDTYRAANNALATYPPPFSYISAGVSIATGLGNVAKIASVKSPSMPKAPGYASGVIGLSGAGTGTSDSINARLSNGESVLTARATSMFPNLLSIMNQMGGGVGLNGMTASENALVQNDMSSSANNEAFMQSIAEAVAIGAEIGTSAGSERGLTNLSDNRQIMIDAKF